MVKHGFYYITDSEIIYLARINKLESTRFKLVKYDMTTNTQGTQPTFNSDEFCRNFSSFS
jgi:hypothetical protein